MNRDALVAMLRGRDPLAAASELAPDVDVTFARGAASADGRLVDGDRERPIGEHRAAHAEGRPSEAVVRYGEGVDVEHVADRLLELAALARETGLLRAVCPVPADGVRTPGSWGVEDLTVVVAARGVLDPSVRVRPSWARLGAQTCCVAIAFGADDLLVPDDDPVDVPALVATVGRRAVPR